MAAATREERGVAALATPAGAPPPELPEAFQAVLLADGRVRVHGQGWSELQQRGYGEQKDGAFWLRTYEALYFLDLGRVQLRRGTKAFSMEAYVRDALRRDPHAWTRYLVYRDLRSRGYVAKEGFGFGVDFRVYDRGDFGRKPAKYVVFALNEGIDLTVAQLAEYVQEITRMGKEPIVAVIERRGEVIYYRLSRARFQGP